MTQISANTLTYTQIFLKIREFFEKEIRNEFLSNNDRLEEYQNLLNLIHSNLGAQLTQFDPFIKGEPPLSSKFNKFSTSISHDASMIAKQIDLLNAKIVNTFNLFNQELDSEKGYLERVASKAKILQMYSKAPAEDLIYVGDIFDNADQVDISRVAIGLNPHIENGVFTLPVVRARIWGGRRVTIDTTVSNGFIGNDHAAIKVPSNDLVDGYDFFYKKNRSISSLQSLVDANPVTSFEYSALNVDKTSNPNVDMNLVSEREFKYISDKKVTPNLPDGELVNWSNFDLSTPLQLKMMIEADISNKANTISITPNFSSMDSVKVNSIKAYLANGDSVDIISDPIYIGSSIVPFSGNIISKYFYNKAVIKFPELNVSKFEIFFEQNDYKNIEVLHSYWKPNYPVSETNTSPFYGLSRFNPDALSSEIYESIEYDSSSLIPSIKSPNLFKDTDNQGKIVQVKLKRRPITYSGFIIKLSMAKVIQDLDDVWILEEFKDYYFKEFENVGSAVIDTNDSISFTDDFTEIFKDANGPSYKNVEDGEDELNRISNYLLLVQEEATDGETYPQIDQVKNLDLSPEDLATYIEDIKLETAPFLYEGAAYLFRVTPIFEYKSYTAAQSTFSYAVPVKLNYEVYSAKKKSICIKDIEVGYDIYATRSQIVSSPYQFDLPVESLMLDVNSSISADYANSINAQFYISVNDSNWIEVSPIRLASRGIAEVLVFNKNLASTYQLPGVAYFNYPDVPKVINSVRVKIELSKTNNVNVTPVINSYTLIAKVTR